MPVCVCVQLVSYVGMFVFSSIIELFGCSISYMIFSMSAIFFFMLVHQIEAHVKYALSTHRGFATVALSISSAKFI